MPCGKSPAPAETDRQAVTLAISPEAVEDPIGVIVGLVAGVIPRWTAR